MTSKQVVYRVVFDFLGETLFEEPYELYSEEIDYLRKKDAEPIFPQSLYHSDRTLQEILDDLQYQLESNEILHHWKVSIPAKDLCYVRYDTKILELGCEHFRHHILFRCACGELFACKYCHSECSQLSVEAIVCDQCKKEIGDSTECCGTHLYDFLCRKCAIASLNVQYHHCEVCGCVAQNTVGHCDTCGRCYFEKDHICPATADDTCPICFEQYDALFLRSVILDCGHKLHQSCYDRMEKRGEIVCPFDRQTVGIRQGGVVAFNHFVGLYSMKEIPAAEIGHYINVECLLCKTCMVFNWHPYGYICCHCLGIRCAQRDDFEGSESEAVEIIEGEYDIVRNKHSRRPIYPLVLFPKDGNEMSNVVDFYTEKYSNFLLEYQEIASERAGEEVPLREVLLAYTFTRIYDENIGFAALNLIHSRQIFPDDPKSLEEASISAMVEVRELRRLEAEG